MKSAIIARNVIEAAATRGWKISISGEIFSASKTFTPQSRSEYLTADQEYYSILSLIPKTRPGSIWGSTSDGIGGHVALGKGFYQINMSGGSKLVLKEIKKLL
jgi:hypothetical protein